MKGRTNLLVLIFFLASTTSAGLSKRYYRPLFNIGAYDNTQGKKTILHPLFFATAPPVHGEMVTEWVEQYLEKKGFDVLIRDPNPNFKRSLEQIAVSGKDTKGEAFQDYIRKSDSETLCDFVMFPFVILRPAELRGNKSRWDSVIRGIPHDGSAHGGSWKGYQKAASLAIAVYNCHGEFVQLSLGGIEIPYRVSITTTYDPGLQSKIESTRSTAVAPVRSDNLDNAQFVNEAIALALHPMIQMVGYPKSPKYLKE